MASTQTVFKLLPPESWQTVIATGEIPFSDLDDSDGFMHLSTQEQYLETASIHYTNFPIVFAVEITVASIEGELRWEPAKKRNNILFPHLYGRAPSTAICAVHKLVQGKDKTFQNTGIIDTEGNPV